MIDLSWGGFTNGKVPDSATTQIDSLGHRLEHNAASRFTIMRADLHAATGYWINAAPGDASCGRTYAEQFYYYQLWLSGKGNTAAVPGKSNHGWWRAIDITGHEGSTNWRSPRTGRLYKVNEEVWVWLQKHAAEYGFSWQTGDYSGESWHWESLNTPSAFAGGDATPINPGEDDDMPLNQGDLNSIAILIQQYVRPIVQQEMNSLNASTQRGIIRATRARLYQNSDTKDYFAIDWNAPKGQRVAYLHGSVGQIARLYNPYQYMGDFAENVVVIDTATCKTLIGIAEGTDSVFAEPPTWAQSAH